MPEEPQVESREQENDADVGEQPFEKTVPEKRKVEADDDRDHRRDVQRQTDRLAHVEPRPASSPLRVAAR